jgi:hypothetical protein
METPQFPNGRKVFYFYPAGDFHKSLVESMIEAEYEVYTLSNHRKGLPLMFQHNGAVILFNIEDHAGDGQLRALLRDFCRQSSHRSIQLYFLTRSEKQVETLADLGGTFSNCSVLRLPEASQPAVTLLRNTLAELNVKGQRRYVRFGSNSNTIAGISFQRKGKRYRGTVHDISSAGLSFSLPEGESLPLRSRLKEVTVDLGSGLRELGGSVTIRRRQPNGTLLHILMFDKEMEPELKKRLRTAIHHCLQRQFTARLEQVAVPESEK